MPVPRIAAIHDLSAFGRCSLTIVIPTLSAMGIQCCPLVTACLSTHTGGFEGNTFLDMTDHMASVTEHWKSLNLTFDGIYTGYMGSAGQTEKAAEFIRTFQSPSCRIIIDPVMGDHGRPYRAYTPEMCRKMAALSELADIITPNRTEAAILLGADYEDVRLDSQDSCRRRVEELSRNGTRSVVLKGASLFSNKASVACFDRESGKTVFYSVPLTPGRFHGTGDLFASILTGALTRGWTLEDAAKLSADIVSQCVETQGTPSREGLDFEPLLWRLGRLMDGRHA